MLYQTELVVIGTDIDCKTGALLMDDAGSYAGAAFIGLAGHPRPSFFAWVERSRLAVSPLPGLGDGENTVSPHFLRGLGAERFGALSSVFGHCTITAQTPLLCRRLRLPPRIHFPNPDIRVNFGEFAIRNSIYAQQLISFACSAWVRRLPKCPEQSMA
jgi:hypothetical protein